MDTLISTAGRALAAGDPLSALNAVALRDDPQALALRGIAMAQLGDLSRARLLLRRAARGFGEGEAVARARCTVAEAEIALVSRDLAWPPGPLAAAGRVLESSGDVANAAHARYLEARYRLLVGQTEEADRILTGLDPAALPLPSRAARALVETGIAIRRVRIDAARGAISEARALAARAGIPALLAEVETAARQLDLPAARLLAQDASRQITLGDIEQIMASEALVIDACRHVVSCSRVTVSLATRPVLFALLRGLAEAGPEGAGREDLIRRVFRAKEADESHRARLRVEIGRLRRELRAFASLQSTAAGFRLLPLDGREVVVIAPPDDEASSVVLALVGDGEAWSSSALALALNMSQRTIQRALDELAANGKVQAVGLGRARRWVAPPALGFPTALLLPGALHGS